MARPLLAGGLLTALLGVGLVLPVVAARLEGGAFTGLGLAVGAVGGGLLGCGAAALGAGGLRQRGPALPSGVRAAVAADGLFLAFFALELSDGLVRQDGRLVYWTNFLFPPALVLSYGLLAARRWAWWTSRALAAVGGLWFLGFVVVIPFADLRGPGGPVPWYGRVYMAGVSLVFAGIVAATFWSLGRPEARRYFGIGEPPGCGPG